MSHSSFTRLHVVTAHTSNLGLLRGRLVKMPNGPEEPRDFDAVSIMASEYRGMPSPVTDIVPLVYVLPQKGPPFCEVVHVELPPWVGGEDHFVDVCFASPVDQSRLRVHIDASARRTVVMRESKARGAVALPHRRFDVVATMSHPLATVPDWAQAWAKDPDRGDGFVGSLAATNDVTWRTVLTAFDAPVLATTHRISSISVGRRHPYGCGWALHQVDATITFDGDTMSRDTMRRWVLARTAGEPTAQCARALLSALDEIEGLVPTGDGADAPTPTEYKPAWRPRYHIAHRSSTDEPWGLRFAKGTRTIVSTRETSPFADTSVVNKSVVAVNGTAVASETDMLEAIKSSGEVLWLAEGKISTSALAVVLQRQDPQEKWGMQLDHQGTVVSTVQRSPSDGNIPVGCRILMIGGKAAASDVLPALIAECSDDLPLIVAPRRKLSMQRLLRGESWGIGIDRAREGPPQISKVVPFSPAHRAGATAGCEITRVNGTTVSTPSEVIAALTDATAPSVELECYTTSADNVQQRVLSASSNPDPRHPVSLLGGAAPFVGALLREAGMPLAAVAGAATRISALMGGIASLTPPDLADSGVPPYVARRIFAQHSPVEHVMGYHTRRVRGVNFVGGTSLLHAAVGVTLDVSSGITTKDGQEVAAPATRMLIVPITEAVSARLQDGSASMETPGPFFSGTLSLLQDRDYAEWWAAYTRPHATPNMLPLTTERLEIGVPVYLYSPFGGRAWLRPTGKDSDPITLDVAAKGPPLRLWPGTPLFRKGRVVAALRHPFSSVTDSTVTARCLESLWAAAVVTRIPLRR